MTLMRNLRELSLSPTGASPILGRRRRGSRTCAAPANRRSDRPPEEIIARLKHLQAGGVAYVMDLDVGGSLAALRIFAREIMPEFAD
jgi:hypothetical protein